MAKVVNLEPSDEDALNTILGIEPEKLSNRALVAKQRLEAKEKIKAAKQALREKAKKQSKSNRHHIQNGIPYPKPETENAELWENFNIESNKKGSPITLDEVLISEIFKDFKKVTLKTQFIKWCIFYGIPLNF